MTRVHLSAATRRHLLPQTIWESDSHHSFLKDSALCVSTEREAVFSSSTAVGRLDHSKKIFNTALHAELSVFSIGTELLHEQIILKIIEVLLIELLQLPKIRKVRLPPYPFLLQSHPRCRLHIFLPVSFQSL